MVAAAGWWAAGWGAALHTTSALVLSALVGLDGSMSYLLPGALAVVLPRMFGRGGRGRRIPWLARLACESGGWYVYMFAGSPDIRLVSYGGPRLGQPFAVVLGAVAAVTGGLVLSGRLRARPRGSIPGASRRRRWVWALVSVPLAVTLGVRAAEHHHVVLLAAWTIVSLLMLLVASLTLVRGQYSWQRPERVHHVDLTGNLAPRNRFSLIVPARDEPVLGRTLTQILAGDYPGDLVELVVMVSYDEVDQETRRVAEEIAGRHSNVRVVAPEGSRRSKPLSLEDARRHCTGDLVGVVDAESLLAGGLLRYVNTLALRHADVGIFQGGVQLMNARATAWRRAADHSPIRAFLHWLDAGTSWWRARNCLEYYIWFMSRLRFQARARFIPLGGNTVFIRRTVLERLGGWDVSCLTEDCDLGVRASAAGIPTAVFYHPDLTTREETPESLTKLIIQRTRWMMGFMQVLFKGDWRALPGARQRIMAVEMLTMPFFQALAGVLLPVSLVLTLFLAAPTGLVIVFWLPFGATVMTVFSEQAAFREFAEAYGLDLRRWDSVRLVLCAPLYQLALSAAAVRATARLLRGRVEWEKTSHSGAHHSTGSGRFELEAAS